MEAVTEARNKVKEHPVTGQGLGLYGTAILINIVDQSGGLPMRNFRDSGTFPNAETTAGDTLTARYLVHNKGCKGCSIGCGRKVGMGKFRTFGEGPEYEPA